MPISIICSQCKKKLTAPDSAAGKKVRCAGCKAVIAVPALEEDLVAPDEELVAPDDDLVEPEKETNVTVSPKPAKKKDVEADKDTGISESPKSTKKQKVAWDDESAESERPKDEGGYGLDEEDERERKRRKKKRKRAEDDDDDYDDFRDRRPRRRDEAHRGALILVLGIVSIFMACIPIICWIVAAIAVNMANTDKMKMERGLMDPSGSGLVTAGQACAYVGSLFGLIAAIAGIALQVSGRF